MTQIAPFLCILTLSGCATTPDDYAKNRDWKTAYESLEYSFFKAKPDNRQDYVEAAKRYPEVVEFGFQQFNQEKIKTFSEHVGGTESHVRKLEFFCSVAPEERCTEAFKNVAIVIAGFKQRAVILKEAYDKLSEEEKTIYSKTYSFKIYSSNEVGVITERQIHNASTLGNAAGSTLGTAIGSAAYIDKAFSGKATNWNYSAKGHLAAQLVGAIVGGSVANTAPNELYRIRYSLRLRNGNTTYVDDVSGTALGYPIGACLHLVGPTLADDSLCK